MVHQQFLARIVFQYLDFPPLGPRRPAFMWIQYLDFPWLHPLSQTLPAWHSFNFNILYIYIWLTKSPTTYNNGFPLLFPPTIAARSAKQVRGSKKNSLENNQLPCQNNPTRSSTNSRRSTYFFYTVQKPHMYVCHNFPCPRSEKNTARSNKSCTCQKTTCAKVQKPSSPKQFSNVGTSLDSLLLVCRVYAKIVQPEW